MFDSRTSASGPRNVPADESSLRYRLSVLLQHRWLVLGTTASVFLATALYTWHLKPVYEGEATLRLSEQDAGSNILSDLSPLAGAAKGKLETEMLVLRSRQIAEAVADSLSLNVELIEPQRARDQVLRVVAAPIDAPQGTYVFSREGNAYRLSAADHTPTEGLPNLVQIGVPFSIGTLRLILVPSLSKAPPERVRVRIRPFWDVVAELRQELRISRPDVAAQVLMIRYRNTDPYLAAAVTNAASTAFISYKMQGGKAETRSTVDFLRAQVSIYEQQLRQAEDRLRVFREQQQVLNLEEQATQQVKRLAELQAQRDALRAERQALAKLLSRVEKSTREQDAAAAHRQLASFPTFLANKAVQDILQSITQLENERAELMVRRTAENMDVAGINLRINELELQLYQLARNYLESIDSQIASAESTLGRFGAEIERIPTREVEFARGLRQQKLLAEMYTLLQTRLKEAEIRQAIEPGDIHIIDRALIPERPVAPKPAQSLVLGGVFGLMLGVGLAFGRRALDTKVRTQDDVLRITSGAPIIGTIPRIRAANGKPGHNERSAAGVAVANTGTFEQRLVTHHSPRSAASEAYRALRTSLTFARGGTAPQMLVVTSAMPGDGKSTSAANLAITLAQQGASVLLVDVDLRKGVLHRVFGVPQEPGLTQMLIGQATLTEAARRLPQVGESQPLTLLPSGTFPPNPSELLGSPKMRALIEQLRGEYEYVIFDAPPLNLATDAAILGTMVDTTILVTRAGVTERGALEHAVSQIVHLQAPFGGVVINDIDLSGDGRYYGYEYAYGVEE